MGWLTSWWDRLVQSVVWKSFFGKFQPMDWGVFGFLFMGFVYGIRQGFWKTLSDLFRLFFVILLSFEYGEWMSKQISHYVGFFPSSFGPMVGFVIVAVLAWFAMTLILKMFKKLFKTSTSAVVRVFGGSFLGIIYIFMLLSLLSQVVLLGPWEKPKEYFSANETYMGPYLSKAAPEVYKRVVPPVKKLFKRAQGTV